jgi:hypothetical protein
MPMGYVIAFFRLGTTEGCELFHANHLDSTPRVIGARYTARRAQCSGDHCEARDYHGEGSSRNGTRKQHQR